MLEGEDRKQNALQGQQARLQDRDSTAHQKDLQMQIASLNESIHNHEALRGVFKKRLDALHESINAGIEPQVSYDLLQTEKENLDNEVRISDMDTQRSDLESQINRIETQRTELSRSLFSPATSGKTGFWSCAGTLRWRRFNWKTIRASAANTAAGWLKSRPIRDRP